MNALTRHLVRATFETVPSSWSLENGQEFRDAVIEKYNLHITAEYLVPLLNRIYRLWQHYHPERFEYESGGGFWPKYHDDELVFAGRRGIAQSVIHRKVERAPDLQLDDWGDYPQQLANPNTEQVKKHYPRELAQALEYQKQTGADYDAICRHFNNRFGRAIPVENIAHAAIAEIQKNPLHGLPLFEGV